jgi:hypothetical protein
MKQQKKTFNSKFDQSESNLTPILESDWLDPPLLLLGVKPDPTSKINNNKTKGPHWVPYSKIVITTSSVT